MRAGWHCNPGAAYGALGLSEEKIAEQIRNHKCFSSTCVHQTALTVVNGVMAGAVRISLGFMTTFEDCDRVVDFFRSRYRMWRVCWMNGFVDGRNRSNESLIPLTGNNITMISTKFPYYRILLLQ